MASLNGLVNNNNNNKVTEVTEVTEVKASAQKAEVTEVKASAQKAEVTEVKGYGETVENLLAKHPKGLITLKVTVSTKAVVEVDENRQKGQMITGVHPGKLSYSFDKKDKDLVRFFMSLSLNPIKVKKVKNDIGGFNSIYHFDEDGPIFVKPQEGLWVAKVKASGLNPEEKKMVDMLKAFGSWEEALPKLTKVGINLQSAKAFWDGKDTSSLENKRMSPNALASALMGGMQGASLGLKTPVKININSTNRTTDWWGVFHEVLLEECNYGEKDSYVLTLYFPATRLKASGNPKGMVTKVDGEQVNIKNFYGEIQQEFNVNWGGGAMPLLRMEWEKGSLWTPDLSSFFSEKETESLITYAQKAFEKETEKEEGVEADPNLLVQAILAGSNGNQWPSKFGILPNKKKKEKSCNMWEEWENNPEYWEEVLKSLIGKKNALAFFPFNKFEEVQMEYLLACAEAKQKLHEKDWLEETPKPEEPEEEVKEETPKPEPKEETPKPEPEEVKVEVDPISLHDGGDLEDLETDILSLDDIELFEEDEDLI